MQNKTLSFIWKFLKQYKFSILNTLIIGIAGTFSNLILTNLVLKNFINEATHNNITLKSGIIHAILFSIASGLSFISGAISKKTLFPACYKMKEKIKNFVFQLSLKQSNAFFSDTFAGTLSSKIIDITSGMELLIQSSIELILCFFGFLFVLILFSIDSLFMGLVFLFVSICYIIIFLIVSKKVKKISKETSSKESDASGKMVDCFNNSINIKSFSTFKKEKLNMNTLSISILKNRSDLEFFKSILLLLTVGYRIFLVATIFLLNLYLFLNNKINVGTVSANITTTIAVFNYLKNALSEYSQSITLYGKISQAVETLYTNPEINDGPNTKDLVIKNAEIEFKNVNFRYKKELPLVFDNLNLKIKNKEKVGIVGYSGSGKSSLISLLLRFYDINSGEILIDNQNIKEDIKQDSLRKNISFIPQEPILFHRTIKENLIYGKQNANDNEIIEACKQAQCYDFILNLENGFYTLVGERGIKLSGGQRQRIAIARAILKNTPILILDEATSALDSLTENEIKIALQNLMKDKTVIVIAHRLSTLDNMDRIIILDKGKIIEDGNKNELLSKAENLFTKMWKMQKDEVNIK